MDIKYCHSVLFIITLGVLAGMAVAEEQLVEADRTTPKPFLRNKGGTTSKRQTGGEECCHNGGTCIMGNFCFCPKNYYGRYCEHMYKDGRCGQLKSGQMVRSDCNLCGCFDGSLMCLPGVFPGCEGEELEDPEKINPFVGKNIEVIDDSVDNKALNLRQDDRHLQHEDYYEYENESDVSGSASGITLPLQKRFVFLCLMFLNVLGHIS